MYQLRRSTELLRVLYQMKNFNLFHLLLLAVFIGNTTSAASEETPIKPHFRVAAVLREPFFFKQFNLDGGESIVGYLCDLLDHLSQQTDLHFTYEIDTSCKTGYGIKNLSSETNETWTGLVGEVAYGRADMAAGDLTISSQREEVITFTKPFMSVDLGMVYKIREPNFDIFAFLMPFTWRAWLLILVALIISTCVLWLFNAFGEGEEQLQGFSNNLYFNFASIFAQGPHSYPTAVYTRIATGGWWFFCLMVLVLYTANLTSSLTVNKTSFQLNEIEDLLRYPTLYYGTTPGGALQEVFESSSYAPFQVMWAEMVSHEHNVLVNYSHALHKVRTDSNFVLIMEYPVLNYIHNRPPCDLELVLGKQSPKTGAGYGLAFKKGSPWAAKFGTEITRMLQSGEMANLYRKWYINRSQCPRTSQLAEHVNGFDYEIIRGIFLVLMISIAVSFFYFFVHLLKRCAKASKPTSLMKPSETFYLD